MRFYITNGHDNQARVNKIVGILEGKGHLRTFAWADHEEVLHGDESSMTTVAMNEVNAIRDAELFICMLPNKKSAHVALGIALATRVNKRIFVWSETGDEFLSGDNAFIFYFHPAIERITGQFTELCKLMESI